MATVKTKEINYLGRDFDSLKGNLIEFAKVYFPEINSDFSDSRPETMLTEMSAYVGDVLSFYTDRALKEALSATANETESIYAAASFYGINPRQGTAATVELEVFQLIPNIKIDGVNQPDYSYALTVDEKAQFSSSTNSSVIFRFLFPVDFKSAEGRESSPYSYNLSNDPEWWLLKKKTLAKSGEVVTTTRTFTTAKAYDIITLSDDNISGILDIVDSDDNKWYEVDSLAQDVRLLTVPNVSRFSNNLSQHEDDTPYLIKIKKTPRRFISKVLSNDSLVIQFGSGTTSLNDEDLVPNQKNIRNTSADFERTLDLAIDPNNFLRTSAYGAAPNNTTLTVRYIKNLGLVENAPAGTINTLVSLPLSIEEAGLDQSILNRVRSSVTVNNPTAATGAVGKKPVTELREDIKSSLSAQKRVVTKSDYILRSLSMPERFGSIAKVFMGGDTQLNDGEIVANPLALNLYLLSYTDEGKFNTANMATKTNLKTYLKHFRVATDAVNIKDAAIINFAIEFSIVVDPSSDSAEGDILLRCVDAIKTLFKPENMEIGTPIILSTIRRVIENVPGVMSSNNIRIKNKYSTTQGYSGFKYDIESAKKNGIILPSKYPSVFELKFADTDIVGMLTGFTS